jgi:hypothetical protein
VAGEGRGGEGASTGEACRSGDDGAKWWRRDGSGHTVVTGWLGTGARRQFGWWRVMARGCGGAVAGGDRVDGRSQARERELTSGACLLEEERGASGRGVAADGWGRPVSGRGGVARARAGAREMGRVGRAGECGARGGGGRERGLGRIQPSRGGEISFFFLFLFP